MSGTEPEAVFASQRRAIPALAFTVNFGVFAGREVSQHEIERLGEALLDVADGASITAENRYEVGARVAGSIHQVRVEIDKDRMPEGEFPIDARRHRLAQTLERWLAQCVSGISGRELEDAEWEARDAIVEVVYGELYPRP